ncbi:hypothetical protein ACXYMU_17725 [Pontibacter sp. CAU 1760]
MKFLLKITSFLVLIAISKVTGVQEKDALLKTKENNQVSPVLIKYDTLNESPKEQEKKSNEAIRSDRMVLSNVIF